MGIFEVASEQPPSHGHNKISLDRSHKPWFSISREATICDRVSQHNQDHISAWQISLQMPLFTRTLDLTSFLDTNAPQERCNDIHQLQAYPYFHHLSPTIQSQSLRRQHIPNPRTIDRRPIIPKIRHHPHIHTPSIEPRVRPTIVHNPLLPSEDTALAHRGRGDRTEGRGFGKVVAERAAGEFGPDPFVAHEAGGGLEVEALADYGGGDFAVLWRGRR